MTSNKSTLPKRDGVSKRIPKKKPEACAILFHYERGKETISAAPLKYGKP
jgi:hypothetical protein